MPPKKTSADYLREWRQFKADHGFEPAETKGGVGYSLAVRSRRARARGVFSDIEIAEIDAQCASECESLQRLMPAASSPAAAKPVRKRVGARPAVGVSKNIVVVKKRPAAGKCAMRLCDSAMRCGAGEGPLLCAFRCGSVASAAASTDPLGDDSLDPSLTGPASNVCLLYTSPSPRDLSTSRMPSSA